jgi:diphthamide biosynthesis protein 7
VQRANTKQAPSGASYHVNWMGQIGKAGKKIEMQNFNVEGPLFQFDSELTADCVEWCPIDSYNHLVVCGTYQLDPQKNQRNGKLFLFSNDHSINSLELLLEKQLDMTGIFDLKWCWSPIAGKPCLAIAGSDASLSLWSLNTCEAEYHLTQDRKHLLESSSSSRFVTQAQELDELDKLPTKQQMALEKLGDKQQSKNENMCLSVDWNNRVHRNEFDKKLIVTQSNGNASLVLLNSSELQVLNTWAAHNFEAWIGAFHYHTSFDFVYTGGDDALMKGWDSRMGYSSAAFVNKSHNAGVCSLQSNPHDENLFASGSYDEYIRIWDVRMLRPGKNPLFECHMGGGVWRLKWHESKKNLLLAACMHNGFHVLNIEQEKIIASYAKHESLAYGVDWCLNAREQDYVCSCSFYDHSVHYWKIIDS